MDPPPNWQKRPVIQDHILQPQSYKVENDEFVIGPSVSVNDYVFVDLIDREVPFVYENFGESPMAFTVARVVDFDNDGEIGLNLLVRPSEVYKNSTDFRELYFTSTYLKVNYKQIRGKCMVQHPLEPRNFEKFREQACNFFVKKYFCVKTHKTFKLYCESEWPKQLKEQIRQDLNSEIKYFFTNNDLPSSVTLNTQANLFMFVDLNGELHKTPPTSINIGLDYQFEVDDYRGHPLVYYLMEQGTPKPVEPAQVNGEVDINLAYVEEMPKGYLARGSSATSTPVSMPLTDLEVFVKRCQLEVAPECNVRPYTAMFLDLCCSVFNNLNGNTVEGMELVRRACTTDQIEPKLSDPQLFLKLVDPYTHLNSWHKIARQMKTPMLTQCLFELMPTMSTFIREDMLALNEVVAGGEYKCLECLTTDAFEYKPVLSYSPFNKQTREPLKEGAKYALCARCARLWFRYKSPWYPHDIVGEQIASNLPVDPDLLYDANSVLNEGNKRAKRRRAAQEKKLTSTIKKFMDRKAKILEKVSLGKGTKSESEQMQFIEKINLEITQTEASLTKLREEELNLNKELLQQPVVEEDQISSAQSSDLESEPATPKKRKQGQQQSPLKKQKQSIDETNRFRGRGPQLSIEKAAENLMKIKDHFGIRLQTKPEYCVVCCQKDPTMAQYNCYFCKLSVHINCYGSRPNLHVTNNNDVVWACECCLNLLQKTDYNREYFCKLCPKRPPLYLEWLNRKEKEFAPDCLKHTVDGYWCHNRCAVFTPDVLFEDPLNLKGVDLTLVNKQLFEGECAVCMARHNDALYKKRDFEVLPIKAAHQALKLKCDLCDLKFHISCAADKGFHFGFTLDSEPRAVVVCLAHKDVKLTPMTEIVDNITALQHFALNKMDGSTHTPLPTLPNTIERMDKQSIINGHLKNTLNQTVILDTNNEIIINNDEAACSACHTVSEPFYMRQQMQLFCKKCYDTGNLAVERKFMVHRFAELMSVNSNK